MTMQTTLEKAGKAAGVPCFVKQLGAMPVTSDVRTTGTVKSWTGIRLKDKKGGDPSEWPADLRVREFPKV